MREQTYQLYELDTAPILYAAFPLGVSFAVYRSAYLVACLAIGLFLVVVFRSRITRAVYKESPGKLAYLVLCVVGSCLTTGAVKTWVEHSLVDFGVIFIGFIASAAVFIEVKRTHTKERMERLGYRECEW